jgi:hypothetical protein
LPPLTIVPEQLRLNSRIIEQVIANDDIDLGPTV